MLKNERQTVIMDLIRKQQNVKVTELKNLFQVSDETIRRDLLELEKQGKLRCIHGGAVYDVMTANEYQIGVRIQTNALEKDAICQEASKLVQDGESLAIAGSTTTLALGNYLAQKNNMTVVTNSIQLASQISVNPTNQVILTGGKVWNSEQKTMGSVTVECFLKYCVDKVFFSVSGISLLDGLTEYSSEELEVLQALLRIGRQAILLNDYTKYKIVAFRRVAEAKNLHAIVTDWHAPRRELRFYESMGVRIYVAAKP